MRNLYLGLPQERFKGDRWLHQNPHGGESPINLSHDSSPLFETPPPPPPPPPALSELVKQLQRYAATASLQACPQRLVEDLLDKLSDIQDSILTLTSQVDQARDQALHFLQ